MNNQFDTILAIRNKPFYFGIGGIGDFLLLMSTFYDDMRKDEFDVIFVANDAITIGVLGRNIFHKLDNIFIVSIKNFDFQADTFFNVLSENNCVGTGVTPKQFKYVSEWEECGKTDVFDYYGVIKYPRWCRTEKISNIICIQPFGGGDDKTKKKEIPTDDLDVLIAQCDLNKKIYMIGSSDDKKRFISNHSEETVEKIFWVDSICDAFGIAQYCSEFYGVDSWGKTVARMSDPNKKVVVYSNTYEDHSTQDMFGLDYDPGDNVFLKDWDYEIEKV
jgi:hypothetical protein